MKKIQLTLIFIACVIVCNSQDYRVVGDPFDYDSFIEIPEALFKLSENEVIIKANVNAVCKVKGCWMTLVSENSDQEIFVKFKDYAFFMPLDLEGDVVVNGVISKMIVSVKELRHYAKDAGKSEDMIMAINTPKEEYHMLASGVAILN